MPGVFRRGDAGPGDVQPPLHVPHRPRQVRAGLQLQVTQGYWRPFVSPHLHSLSLPSLCAPSIICETKSVIWMSERGKFSGLIKLTLSWFYINLPGVWTDPSLGRGCWCWPIFSILCGRDVETWGRSRFKQYYVVQHSRHSQDQGTISTAWNTECLPLQTLSGVGEDPVRGQLQPGAVHGRRQGVLPEDPQAAQPRHCLLSLQVRFLANMLFGLSPNAMFCCPPHRSIC